MLTTALAKSFSMPLFPMICSAGVFVGATLSFVAAWACKKVRFE